MKLSRKAGWQRRMAAGLVSLWLVLAGTSLIVARSGSAGESCCHSKKNCCCRTRDGKSGWKASAKCPRTCTGASLQAQKRPVSAGASAAAEVPFTGSVISLRQPVARCAALRSTRLGRAPPPLV